MAKCKEHDIENCKFCWPEKDIENSNPFRQIKDADQIIRQVTQEIDKLKLKKVNLPNSPKPNQNDC